MSDMPPFKPASLPAPAEPGIATGAEEEALEPTGSLRMARLREAIDGPTLKPLFRESLRGDPPPGLSEEFRVQSFWRGLLSYTVSRSTCWVLPRASWRGHCRIPAAPRAPSSVHDPSPLQSFIVRSARHRERPQPDTWHHAPHALTLPPTPLAASQGPGFLVASTSGDQRQDAV